LPIADKLQTALLNVLMGRWIPYPRAVVIEPVNVCQLECPLCPTGAGKLNYDPMMMSLETFKRVIAKVPFAKTILLHKAGEPFLNPDVLSMVRHAADQKMEVIVSTNFSFTRPDQFFDDLVNSGLHRLVVSLDGASQESYAKYRIGGSYELVIANIKKLVQTKICLGQGRPEIVWQFLVNRFNEDEIETARKISQQLQIQFDVRPMDISDNLPDVELDGSIEDRKNYWIGKNKKYICDRYNESFRYPVYSGLCPNLFSSVVITVDGKVLPCCEVWDKGSVFGDLLSVDSFGDIWFSQEYVQSRLRMFRRDSRDSVKTVCFRCQNYGTTPSCKDALGLLKTLCGRLLG
jgi:MoaA/NifB/PqqE/SkfB family radical SAM enzyme